jgi:hypothetical protein
MVAEEGDTDDNILRMEILDGLYEHERSSDELLRQVKKRSGSWWGQHPRDPARPLRVREVIRWTSLTGKKAGSWRGQHPQDPGRPLRVQEVIRWTSSPGKKGVDKDCIFRKEILDGLYE